MKIIHFVWKPFLKFLAFFPTRLPIGDGQYEKWFSEVCYLYDLPPNDSVRFALSTMLMHAAPVVKPGVIEAVVNSGASYYKSKRYFGLTALKGAVNQTAHQIMADCKLRQEERNKAEADAAKQAAEDAATGKTTVGPGPKLAEAPASEQANARQPSGPQGSA